MFSADILKKMLILSPRATIITNFLPFLWKKRGIVGNSIPFLPLIK
jgi:hypothetical protein